MNRTVRMRQLPRRIVSIVPSQTELLFDLGLTDEVVGITKFCVHPTEMFQSKPRVGGTKKLNFERIEALQPDLIIGNKEENERSDIEYLEQHYPVWMSDIANLQEALSMIVEVGKLVDREKAAFHLAQEVRNSFLQFDNENLNCKGKRVAYLIWNSPMMVAGGGTFIDHMLALCGMTNVFKGVPRYPEVTVEQLQTAEPDLILLSSEPFPFKEKHVAHYLSLVPESTVKVVDGEIFSWYGSRLLKATPYFQEQF